MKTKYAKFLIIIFGIIFIFPLSVYAETFLDVPTMHFSYDAIELLSQMKVIKGYSNPSVPSGLPIFKPENPVTRVEALKIIMEGARLAVPDVDSSYILDFKDLKLNGWYLRYVKKGKELGIVKGNPDGAFAPDKQVNKVELLKMLIIANKLDVNAANAVDLPFVDLGENVWYTPYIKYGVKYNIIYPTPTGKLEPGKNLTRAEVAEIVYRLVIIQKGGELQSLLSQAEAALVQTLQYISIKNYNKAKDYNNKAIVFTEQALLNDDKKPIVQAANKVSLALSKIVDALMAVDAKNKSLAITAANEAIVLSNEAEKLSNRTKVLTDKIFILANNIIEQNR